MYCYRIKQKKTYIRMIELLSEETSPNPGKMLADFEKAALNAFNKKFPHAEISCCYFHLTQSFNRKINKIGLKTYYKNFPEFNLALRILVVIRRIFGCPYGTWKKIQKCRSLNMFKKLPDYCAPSAPDTKKIKNRCCKISEALMSSKMLCHISEQ